MLIYFKQQFYLEKNTDFSKYKEGLSLVAPMIKLNSIVAHFFVEAGLLVNYFSTFIHIQKIISASISAKTSEKDNYNSTNIIKVFEALEALMRSCITDAMFQYESLAPTYLFKEEVDWKTCPRILTKIVREIQDYEVFKKCFLPMQEKCDNFIHLAQHIAWMDKETSKRMIYLLIGQTCRFFYHLIS